MVLNAELKSINYLEYSHIC